MADTDKLFKVEIITPERIFYSGDASMIEFTTTEGDIGVYKKHIPLTAVLAPGIVTITENSSAKKAAGLDVKRAEIALKKALVRINIAK